MAAQLVALLLLLFSTPTDGGGQQLPGGNNKTSTPPPITVLQDDQEYCPSPVPDDGSYVYICREEEFGSGYSTAQAQILDMAATPGPRMCTRYGFLDDGGTVSALSYYMVRPCQSDDFNVCHACYGTAATIIGEGCRNRVGAQIASKDCCIRYEPYRYCKPQNEPP